MPSKHGTGEQVRRMRHSLWIITVCLGWMIPDFIRDGNIKDGIPAVIALVVVFLIACGILPV